MVGGGQGAFIGAVHRIAARLDGRFTLVAGALSSDPARARASGAELGLAADRSYASYEAMAAAEAVRADGIEAVAIVTPNHLHAGPAVAFLNQGIHVICDKPLAATMRQAEEIVRAASASTARFFLTQTYTGYPMVREARAMIARGDLGTLRTVQIEYAQDWLTDAVEGRQADWRTDPARSGEGGCIGDIGTHAWNLSRFVTGLVPEAVLAELATFVPGRRVDDNAQILIRFAGGGRGMLWASQVAPGNENALRLRVYGDRGGLEWGQEDPNRLAFTPYREPRQILTRAGACVGPDGQGRVPAGHPEGYLEAFATLYADAADIMQGCGDGTAAPGLEDGMDGMRFIAASLESFRAGGAWVRLHS